MEAHRFLRTTLFLAFTALPGFADTAEQAGAKMSQSLVSDAGPARIAMADPSNDNDALYDYRSVYNGGRFYAPGSYGSWSGSAPPLNDVAVAAPSALPTPSPRLPTYYDYDRHYGPLFG